MTIARGDNHLKLLAVFLALGLALPNPSFALRETQEGTAEAKLEAILAAGMEEPGSPKDPLDLLQTRARPMAERGYTLAPVIQGSDFVAEAVTVQGRSKILSSSISGYYWILSGNGKISIGPKSGVVQPGILLRISAQTPHQFNSSGEPLHFLQIFPAPPTITSSETPWQLSLAREDPSQFQTWSFTPKRDKAASILLRQNGLNSILYATGIHHQPVLLLPSKRARLLLGVRGKTPLQVNGRTLTLNSGEVAVIPPTERSISVSGVDATFLVFQHPAATPEEPIPTVSVPATSPATQPIQTDQADTSTQPVHATTPEPEPQTTPDPPPVGQVPPTADTPPWLDSADEHDISPLPEPQKELPAIGTKLSGYTGGVEYLNGLEIVGADMTREQVGTQLAEHTDAKTVRVYDIRDNERKWADFPLPSSPSQEEINELFEFLSRAQRYILLRGSQRLWVISQAVLLPEASPDRIMLFRTMLRDAARAQGPERTEALRQLYSEFSDSSGGIDIRVGKKSRVYVFKWTDAEKKKSITPSFPMRLQDQVVREVPVLSEKGELLIDYFQYEPWTHIRRSKWQENPPNLAWTETSVQEELRTIPVAVPLSEFQELTSAKGYGINELEAATRIPGKLAKKLSRRGLLHRNAQGRVLLEPAQMIADSSKRLNREEYSFNILGEVMGISGSQVWGRVQFRELTVIERPGEQQRLSRQDALELVLSVKLRGWIEQHVGGFVPTKTFYDAMEIKSDRFYSWKATSPRYGRDKVPLWIVIDDRREVTRKGYDGMLKVHQKAFDDIPKDRILLNEAVANQYPNLERKHILGKRREALRATLEQNLHRDVLEYPLAPIQTLYVVNRSDLQTIWEEVDSPREWTSDDDNLEEIKPGGLYSLKTASTLTGVGPTALKKFPHQKIMGAFWIPGTDLIKFLNDRASAGMEQAEVVRSTDADWETTLDQLMELRRQEDTLKLVRSKYEEPDDRKTRLLLERIIHGQHPGAVVAARSGWQVWGYGIARSRVHNPTDGVISELAIHPKLQETALPADLFQETLNQLQAAAPITRVQFFDPTQDQTIGEIAQASGFHRWWKHRKAGLKWSYAWPWPIRPFEEQEVAGPVRNFRHATRESFDPHHLNLSHSLERSPEVTFETASFGQVKAHLRLGHIFSRDAVFVTPDKTWKKAHQLDRPYNEREAAHAPGIFGFFFVDWFEIDGQLGVLIDEIQPGDWYRRALSWSEKFELDAWRRAAIGRFLEWALPRGLLVFASTPAVLQERYSEPPIKPRELEDGNAEPMDDPLEWKLEFGIVHDHDRFVGPLKPRPFYAHRDNAAAGLEQTIGVRPPESGGQTPVLRLDQFRQRYPKQAPWIPAGANRLVVMPRGTTVTMHRPDTLAQDLEVWLAAHAEELPGGIKLQPKPIPPTQAQVETVAVMVLDAMGKPLPYRSPVLVIKHWKGQPFKYSARKLVALAFVKRLDATSIQVLTVWEFKESGRSYVVLALQV